MSDVSGIPNMGFGGGSYFGGNAATGQPAMSADQINAGIWGNYSPQQAQHTLNNIYGAQGFGGLTSHYSSLGAAHGRATGGFGGAAGRVGTISNPGKSNPGYLTPAANRNTLASLMASRGTTTDFSSQNKAPEYSGGGIGSDIHRGGQNTLGNALAAQRAAYASTVRNNPKTALNLAARLYSEDKNSSDTRTAIMESMLNRQAATKQNPLNAAYYPKSQTAYNKALNTMQTNPTLRNQVTQDALRAFQGSNLSNYATNWASGNVAKKDLKQATPTWTSPTKESFYRKDINNPFTGAGTATANQRWFQSMSGLPR